MIRRIIFAFTLLMLASPAWAQSGGYKEPDDDKPPQRYANMPDEAVPYRRFTKPYYDWFVQTDTLAYNGAAEKRPDGDPSKLSEIAIGFMAPIENNPESIFGLPLLHGAQLAIEEANARGGYHGKPYSLKVHNESPSGRLLHRTREDALQ